MGLYRSRTNRMIAGVCGGIAEHFNLDPTLVRLLYVVISVFSAAVPGALLYVILWAVVPEAPVAQPNIGTTPTGGTGSAGGGAAPPPPPPAT